MDVISIRAGYRAFSIRDVSLTLPAGQVTALIGPNGCGKSTLLSAMAGLIPLKSGSVRVAGQDIKQTSAKAMARHVSLLPQFPVVPPAVTVEQLVAYGRAPYQNFLGMRLPGDDLIIEAAMHRTGIIDRRSARLSELSGGQRQRAFIAMTMAQDTPIMLFDEPTSFLDIRYQYETLELLASFAREGRTVAVVLHDIGQAARYADNVVAMLNGTIRYAGAPSSTITREMVEQIYGLRAKIFADPVSGTPQVSPEMPA